MSDMTLTKEDLVQIRGIVRDEVRTEIQQAVEPLFAAVQQDIQRLDARIDGLEVELQTLRADLVVVRNQIASLTDRMVSLEGRMDDLITSVDGYAKRTNDWYQEVAVLKARHNVLHGKLVERGIVTDDELTLG